jgi:hypothetical protein
MPTRKTTRYGHGRRRGGSKLSNWASKALGVAKKYKIGSRAGTYAYGRWGKPLLDKKLAGRPNAKKMVDAGVKAALSHLRQKGYGTRMAGNGTRRTGNGTRMSGMGRRMKY